jgi:hypothetical protein
VVSIGASEAQRLLTDLRMLRRHIVDAWQERGVILTREEQRELRDEIKLTCEILAGLTPRR